MKHFAIALSFFGLMLLLPGCASSPGGKATAAAAAPASGEDETTMVLTGSYIPQQVNLAEPFQSGCNPVTVITSEDIRNSGVATLPRVLQKTGNGR